MPAGSTQDHSPKPQASCPRQSSACGAGSLGLSGFPRVPLEALHGTVALGHSSGDLGCRLAPSCGEVLGGSVWPTCLLTWVWPEQVKATQEENRELRSRCEELHGKNLELG